MRDDQRNYILVGVFVIAAVVGLLLWLALLSGRTGSTEPYYLRFTNVLGLSEGTQIYYSGFPVGLIDSIAAVDDGDPQLFRLNVSIREGWKIPSDSVAKITAASVLSAVVINISDGESETYLEPGSQIPSKEPENLIAVVTEAASGFSAFLGESLQPQITSIVEDLNATMDQVKLVLSDENTVRIANILENLEGVSGEVQQLAVSLGGTTEQVDATLLQLDQAIQQVNALLLANEGDLSHAVIDLHEALEAVARHADAIAVNLETTTRNMDEFSQQIRTDPGVLLRGRSGADDPAGSN